MILYFHTTSFSFLFIYIYIKFFLKQQEKFCQFQVLAEWREKKQHITLKSAKFS